MNEEPLIKFHANNVSIGVNSSLVIGLVMESSSSAKNAADYLQFMETFKKQCTVLCTVKNFMMEKQIMEDIHKYLNKRYPSLAVCNMFRNPVTCSGCEGKLKTDFIFFGECKNCGGVVLVKEDLHIATESGQCAIYD